MSAIQYYEDGKAISGDAPQTKASGITFDNTNSDLVSEDVESAIKEVNNRTKHGIVELWKNSSIGTDFAGQSINVLNYDTTKYDGFILCVSTQGAYQRGSKMYYFGNEVLSLTQSMAIDDALIATTLRIFAGERSLSFSLSGTTLTITLGDCMLRDSNSQSTQTSNGWLVPTNVLGVIHN